MTMQCLDLIELSKRFYLLLIEVLFLVSKKPEMYYWRPFTWGELVWIVLNMLMSTRNIVMSSVILPGITWNKWSVSRRSSYMEQTLPELRWPTSHLWIDKKWYPGDDYKEAWGQVVCHHVEGHFPGQDDFKSRHAVVHVEGRVLLVLRGERVDLDVIVQDGPDGLLLDRNELVFEDQLVHGIVETANLKCANL